MSLEEQFQESEKRRLEVEDKKVKQSKGEPSSESERILRMFEDKELGEKYREFIPILDLSKVAVEVKEAVESLPLELQTQFQSVFDRFLQVLGEVQKRQSSMETKLDADLEQRRKMRKKEDAVLDKLNRYLDNWL
jgi:phage terminase Nu1 subunit (DNA packaging protein)